MVVYIVWGTTYLAIRVAVREGGGFSPFALGASRLLVAGSVLLIAAAVGGHSLRLKPKELGLLAFTSILMWNGANGLVMLGETRADSGYAALLVSTSPIWASLLETTLDRKLPPALLIGSLVTGFLGLVVLSAPNLMHGGQANILAIAAIMGAPIAWSVGSVIQQRSGVKVNPIVGSGYQQLVAGVVFALLSVTFREHIPHPNHAAWLAWTYLVVFGSLLCFTSYTMALRLLPMSTVMTYAYVNPVVAVFLGWVILREPLSVWTFAGTILVVLSVAGTFRAKYRRPTPLQETEASSSTTPSRLKEDLDTPIA